MGDSGDHPNWEAATIDVRTLPWWTPEDDAALELVTWAILDLFTTPGTEARREECLDLARAWILKREAQARYEYLVLIRQRAEVLAREAWLERQPAIPPARLLGYGP